MATGGMPPGYHCPKKFAATESKAQESRTAPLLQERSPQQQAIDAYREKVKASATQQCSIHRKTDVNLTSALSCLHLTTPSLTLEYPSDAQAHFHEIRMALAPWAQHEKHVMHEAAGYQGPWIENHWISHFEKLYDDRAARGEACLSDLFGPFIPIFVPWVDLWVTNRFKYPTGLVETLRSMLRPNVPYITVSQNDDGLPGRHRDLTMDQIPNVLVLSAGGYGHVPIPLLKQQEDLKNEKDPQNRSIFLSYVGSLGNAPKQMRSKINASLAELLPKSPFQYRYYYGVDWRKVMADSRFSLAPRGFGRTSYHVVEVLQSGLIPIHVYTDVPWVPYADLFDKIAFTVQADGMDALVDRLKNMTLDGIREREQMIVAMRDSHFSPAGVKEQIEQFLMGKDTDLRCQQLPGTVRDESESIEKSLQNHSVSEESPVLQPKINSLPKASGRERCLISAYGADGVGHQMEAKLSCMATAASLNLTYVHIPMDKAEHGVNALAMERFFGLGTAVTNLDYAVLFNNTTMQNVKREPLPWVGKCLSTSWFDASIRQSACSQVHSATTKGVSMLPVFTADNCWDYFWCQLLREPASFGALWRDKIGPILHEAFLKDKDSLRWSTVHEHFAIGKIECRGTSSKGRRCTQISQSFLFQGRFLINSDKFTAHKIGMRVIIHSDATRHEVAEYLSLTSKDLNDTVIYGRDSSVSLELAIYHMVVSDVFLASDSSLSNTAALLRSGPVITPPNHDRHGMSSLGWRMMNISANALLVFELGSSDGGVSTGGQGRYVLPEQDYWSKLVDEAQRMSTFGASLSVQKDHDPPQAST